MRLPPELHFLTTDVGLARVCWPSFRHIEANDDGTLLCLMYIILHLSFLRNFPYHVDLFSLDTGLLVHLTQFQRGQCSVL